jgi:voltage-gated potassium channel
VIIENDEEKISSIRQNEKDLLYLEGDATLDDVLLEAGIEQAKGLICSLSDDSDNLFIVLSARQLNRKLNIISRAVQERSQSKLIKAGADHVVMPENIGGFYMATLINKPSAVEFFSFITREYESDIGFEELHYEDLKEQYKGLPIREMHLRAQTGANIIGYRNKMGTYQVNPGPDTILNEGASFIVLGSKEQLAKLHELVEKEL